MHKSLNYFKNYWPIIFLAISCIFLRLYKLEELTYFSFDEAIPAFVGKNMLEAGKIPLIGGVTPFGVHLTPYFYWLLGAIIAIANLDPIYWGVTSAILSAATFFLLYKVGKEFFNKKVGLYAGTIWTFSYILNLYDRHFWALYWGPIICLSTIYCLRKIIEGDKKFTIILSGIFVWSIATDPSNLVFIFITLASYALFKIRIQKEEIIGVIVILLSLTPLAVFDIKHNFANTKPILEYLAAEKSASRFENQSFFNRTDIFTQSYVRLIYPFTDNEVGKQYAYCREFITEKYSKIPVYFKLSALVAILAFIFLSIKSKKLEINLIVLTIGVYFVGIQSYGTIFNGDIFEHYITGLFPIYVLISAYFLSQIPKKYAFSIIGIFVLLNLLMLSKAENNHGLKFKKQAIQFVSSEFINEPFSLDSVSTCWKYSGYRYLFAAYGNEPVKSYVDPNLGHLYGRTLIAEEHPNFAVAFFTHDFIPETEKYYKLYALYKSNEIKSSIFGNIEVIIVDNNSKWLNNTKEEIN